MGALLALAIAAACGAYAAHRVNAYEPPVYEPWPNDEPLPPYATPEQAWAAAAAVWGDDPTIAVRQNRDGTYSARRLSWLYAAGGS